MDKSIINEMIQSFELEVGRMSLKEAKEYYERYGLELDPKAWKKLNERAKEYDLIEAEKRLAKSLMGEMAIDNCAIVFDRTENRSVYKVAKNCEMRVADKRIDAKKPRAVGYKKTAVQG